MIQLQPVLWHREVGGKSWYLRYNNYECKKMYVCYASIFSFYMDSCSEINLNVGADTDDEYR